MKRILLALLFALLLAAHIVPSQVEAAQPASCLFFTETGGGLGGYSVCDDGQARFRTAFTQWGLQRIGYPISRRYLRDGFVTQAFQKGIMQWRADTGSVSLVNTFDELHSMGFDERLLQARQTPLPLPEGWDGAAAWPEIVSNRQALLNAYPALRDAYFAAGDPLTFFGLPTSEVTDVGNHYAIRLQRGVLQEWKEDVPWAKKGQVTIANGGDLARELGALPEAAVVAESGPGTDPALPLPPGAADDQDGDGIPAAQDSCPDQPETRNGVFERDGCPDSEQELFNFAVQEIDTFWRKHFESRGLPYRSPQVVAYQALIYTECGELEPENAGYCPTLQTIYYDSNFLTHLLQLFGDFAPIAVLAHEWGHHVQSELGLLHSSSVERELQADCLAGVFTNDAGQRTLLDEGDVEEGANLIFLVGDPEETPWDDPNAHGSGPQRHDAFSRGVEQGMAGCMGDG
ncbi:MAG: neutral zinc metallopeptidase [Ardenticatenales bacterium]|nr:neutral zinc metallopeptidase [Ardenticatenales bacterium]